MSKSPLALLAVVLAFAEVSVAAPLSDPAARGASSQQQRLYRGTRIIGSTVRDAKDKKIGVIKDLLLDSQRGEIAYAAVSFGGVMGVGEQYHAIPWTALEPSDDGRFYVLRVDKETIAKAPAFDKARWPDVADGAWRTEVDRYWRRMVGHGAANTNRLGVSGVSAPGSTVTGPGAPR